MQRKVRSTRYTFAENEIDKEGNLVSTLSKIQVQETDKKRAYKTAVKVLGHDFHPLKTEVIEKLWVLDDEIFFLYAEQKEGTERVVEIDGVPVSETDGEQGE